MKIEKIKEIIYERLNKLTYDEREWIKYNLAGWYNTYLFKHNMDEFSDNTWQSLWCWSAFGDCYDRNKTLAKKFLSCEKKMNYVMDRMEDRKMWYDTGVTMIKNLYTTGRLTETTMSLIISKMRKDNFNVFESHVHDPIFETGAIVQFRSNIGVDAVIEEVKYRNRINHYGAGSDTLNDLKRKTMMILGESPPLGGKVYAGVYSHNEKAGGSRYYRVLPVGDTKVYVVVEKFLKKCRTKAVKDARK